MSKPFLVILGPQNAFKDNLYSIEDCENIAKKEKSNYEMIILIGRGFRYSKFDDENIISIYDDASRIFTETPHPDKDEIEEKIEYGVILHQKSIFSDFVIPLTKSEDIKTIFLCVDPQVAPDPYSLASLLKVKTFTNKRFIICRNKDYKSCISDSNELANIFTGARIDLTIDKMNEEERKSLRDLLREGCAVILSYLYCGVHKNRNMEHLPAYALTISSKWLGLLVSIFDIHTTSPDLSLDVEILDLICVRMTLLLASVKVLSNYFYRVEKNVDMKKIKEMAKSVEDVFPEFLDKMSEKNKEVAKGWLKEDLWEMLYSNLL